MSDAFCLLLSNLCPSGKSPLLSNQRVPLRSDGGLTRAKQLSDSAGCMQAIVQDFEEQIQAIKASYAAAGEELDSFMSDRQQHYSKCQAQQLLAFQTAKAETSEIASEEYNMLKVSQEAQVRHLHLIVPCA